MYPNDSYRPSGFGGFSLFPPVIKNLLLINFVVFLVYNILLPFIKVDYYTADRIITRYFALMPFDSGFYVWQLISYQFLHGDFWHIFFNMFALWMFGMEIESMWGSKKFLIYYLSCGIGGALLHMILSPMLFDRMAPTVGASGAIFGIMLAFAMLFPNRYIFIYFLIPVKAKYLIAFLILLEFLSVGDAGFIARLVHLGGALTGFAFLMFDRSTRTNFDFRRMVDSFKKPGATGRSGQFRKNPYSQKEPVREAEFYEINKNKNDNDIEVTQEEIDRILDKISQSGYQNLTEKEKRILFEASKKS